jgi:aspartate aminotransferase
VDIQLSQRVQAIKPSPTLAVTKRANEMKQAGHDIIGLGAGEPDFDTPQFIKDAAIDALNKGYTKYTAVDGIPELKQAICDKFKRDNQFDYTPAQILVSVGGKHSFYNLAQALLNPGDEVIIPAPYWVSYPDMVLLAGGVPVIVEAGIEQGLKITPEQLEQAITPKTKLFVINSPSNPTGVHYSDAELKALGDVLLNNPHVVVASDDMYEHIIWAGQFSNILNHTPALYDRCMVLNGVSKAYSMTGWRIGYAAGPEKIIKAMTKIQSQSTSNPTSISQYASLAALTGEQGFITDMVNVFKERHDFVCGELLKIDGVSCLPAQGTFYTFPDMRQVIERVDGISNDIELGEYLIEKGGVAAVPGSAFGADGYLRLSFATSMENLQKALGRMQETLS